MDYGAMATALTLFIAMLLAVLVWDWQRGRRQARKQAEAVETQIWGHLPGRAGRKRRLKLHWSWLLLLAAGLLLAGSGMLALDWFADTHNHVVVGYSGK